MKKFKKYLAQFSCFVTLTLQVLGQSQPSYPFQDNRLAIDTRIDDLLSRLTLNEKVSFMLTESPGVARLGIPEYNWWNECLHGVARNGLATVFPQSITLASTFDDSLVFSIASAIGDEARAKYNLARKIGNRGIYSGLTFFSPMINIFRDPRWGRGQETFGEDPYLSGMLAVAYIHGLQGNDPVYFKTSACAKAFAVHSGPEKDRTLFNVFPSKKDLMETFLPAFEMAVTKGNADGVMCSYSSLYNQPCCGNPFLLKDILRTRYNFQGHVVTDCGAIPLFHENFKVTSSPVESAVLAIESGVNISCVDELKYLVDAVKQGLIDENLINERVRPVLRTRIKLGMFDNPGICPFDTLGEEIINSSSNRALARLTACKAIVLLKNKNNTLPLKKDTKSYYLVGPGAGNVDVLIGNYYGSNDNMATIYEGITAKVNKGTSIEYKYGFNPFQETTNPLIDWHLQQMGKANATIVVAGLSGLYEGEAGETVLSSENGDRTNIQLPGGQVKFLKALRAQAKTPIILVLTGGSPIALAEVEDLCDAIVFVGYPGEEGGNAVADVLFGDYNPSGRLPFTVPKSVEQLPPFSDYSMNNRTYRYMTEEPEFPFGFGLSYTTFAYENISIDKPVVKEGDYIKVVVTVRNTGKTDGNEIVQLYTSQQCDTLALPKHSLKGFRSIFLKAGESKKVEFIIGAKSLLQVNNNGDEIFLPGKMKIIVAGVSPGARGIAWDVSGQQEMEVILK